MTHWVEASVSGQSKQVFGARLNLILTRLALGLSLRLYINLTNCPSGHYIVVGAGGSLTFE